MTIEMIKERLEDLFVLQKEMDECIEIMEDGPVRQMCEVESATLFELIDRWFDLIEKMEKEEN